MKKIWVYKKEFDIKVIRINIDKIKDFYVKGHLYLIQLNNNKSITFYIERIYKLHFKKYKNKYYIEIHYFGEEIKNIFYMHNLIKLNVNWVKKGNKL